MDNLICSYVGTYRVLAEHDKSTNDWIRDEFGNIDSSFCDFYIPFSNNKGRVEYFDDTTLIFDIFDIDLAKDIIDKLKKKFHVRNLVAKNIVEKITKTDAEYLIYIKANELSLLTEYLPLSTKGKNVEPFDDRNLPVQYNIPQKDLKPFMALKEKFVNLKPYLLEDLTRNFVLSACHMNPEAIRNSGLPYIKFIHQQNLWDKYLEYLSKNAK